MPEDEEVIEGLIQGIQSQSDKVEVNSDISENYGIGVIGGENNEVVNSEGHVGGSSVNIHVIPQQHAKKVTQDLRELKSLVDDPQRNEGRIKYIYNNLKENVPFAAGVLSICDFAGNVGLA